MEPVQFLDILAVHERRSNIQIQTNRLDLLFYKMFMPHEENISLLVDTYQNSVQRKGNLEVRLVTSVSNLCSNLHFSGTLGNVFVLNLFSSCIYYNTRFPICQVLFLADHRGLEPLLSDLESDVLPLNTNGLLVGVTGFEPVTTWTQTMHSTRLNYTPLII